MRATAFGPSAYPGLLLWGDRGIYVATIPEMVMQ